MSFTKLTKDLDIIQKLDDEPNDVGGLTASELKKKFDDSGNAIKEYLNETLVPELDTAVGGKTSKEYVDTEVAKCIPRTGTSAVRVEGTFDVGEIVLADDIGGSLEAGAGVLLIKDAGGNELVECDIMSGALGLYQLVTPTKSTDAANKGYVDQKVADVVSGQIADGSVTTEKIADKAVTAAKLASTISGSFDVAGLELVGGVGDTWTFGGAGSFEMDSPYGGFVIDPPNGTITIDDFTLLLTGQSTSPAANAVVPKSYVDTQVAAVKPVAHLVTLTSSGWDATTKRQTVVCSGVLADETKQLILPAPSMASAAAYRDAWCRCVTQAANSLTFQCDVVPTTDITVYIGIAPVTYS